MAKFGYFASGSSLALALTLGLAGQAGAQTPAADDDDGNQDVVITGTLIRGAPEDAAIPVNTLSAQEIKRLGSPSNVDMVRQFTQTGMIQGEYTRVALPAGAGSVNTRALTSARSVVLMNGIRLPAQTGSIIGGFQNTAFVPNFAVETVQTVSDGGAVTYGADAVGGVTNFITKRNLDGVTATASYRFIDGSDGDYGASILAGKQINTGNLMFGVGYEHRSDLSALEREFSQLPYLTNPDTTAWATASGTYTPRNAALTAQIVAGGYSAPGGSTGASIRDQDCDNFQETYKGFGGLAATPSPTCTFHVSPFEHLVSPDDRYQAYGEANFDLSDAVRLHGEVSYSNQQVQQYESPSLLPSVGPGTVSASASVQGYFTYGANPAVADFLTGFGGFTQAQFNAITGCAGCVTMTAPAANTVGSGRIEMTPGLWRPFSVGGSPFTGTGAYQSVNYHNFRGSLGLLGELGKVFGTDLSWDVTGTYNYNTYRRDYQDILVERLQKALSGYGGEGCDGAENDVAANRGNNAIGCYYFNPFYSATATDPVTGAANPGYAPSLANSAELIDWLYENRYAKYTQNFFVGDAKLQGDGGIELPGGPVQWVVGGQYRFTREQLDLDDRTNRDITPCAINESFLASGVSLAAQTPGVGACASRSGPWLGGTALQNEETIRNFPVISGFGEARLPVLDNLDVTLAFRYEKFFSDRTEIDNEVFIPAGSLKWTINDNLYFRASAGETFSNVDPPTPGFTSTSATVSSTYGGGNVPTSQYRNVDIKPETGFNYNFGFGFNVGNLRGRLDYFSLHIDDYVDGVASADLIAAAFNPRVLPATQGTVKDCSSPLFQPQAALGGQAPITLVGPCVNGVTTLSAGVNTTAFAYLTNINAGSLDNTAIDGELSYLFDDFAGGSLQVGGAATYNLTYERSASDFFGAVLAQGWDGVGSVNLSTGRNSQTVPELKATAFINFNRSGHNVRLSGRYMGELLDDRTDTYDAVFTNNTNPVNPAACVAGGTTAPADAGTGNAAYDVDCNIAVLGGKHIEDSVIFDLAYTTDLPWDTSLAFTVQNVFDDDPPFTRTALSYSGFTADPLGRTFRLRMEKKF